MKDTITSEQVTQLLKLCREGDILSLATTGVAQSLLVDGCFLTGEAVASDVRGRALQSVLRWGVDRLRPAGGHSWLAISWRPFNILHALYIEGLRVAEVAERMAVAEQTLYQNRPNAISTLTNILNEELAHSQHADQRKQYALTDRYQRHPAAAQQLLRAVAIFRHPIPVRLLYTLLSETNDVQSTLTTLLESPLLVTDSQATTLLLHPDMQSTLMTLQTPEERTRWHTLAAQHYVQARRYVEAAHHWWHAGSAEIAAQLLIDHYQAIVDDLQVEELQMLLAQFHEGDVTAQTWAGLKLVGGKSAEFSGDLHTALQEYGALLGADDIRTRAAAYHLRAGIVFKLHNVDEALMHYLFAIELLEEHLPDDPLLPRLYIDNARLLIDECYAPDRALPNLERAQTWVDNTAAPPGLKADLAEAWAIYFFALRDYARVIVYHLRAWMIANQLQDIQRLLHIGHNLGMNYILLKQHDQALDYLERTRTLATEAGNHSVRIACEKTIGGCYFELGDYAKALAHYKKAYAAFKELGNANWLAHTCYDLAELYAQLKQTGLLQEFYAEGVALAQMVKDEHLLADFAQLGEAHLGGISAEISPRQLQALTLVRQNGAITNRQYRELTGVSQKQAVRDLNELVQMGQLQRVGSGRSTRYQFLQDDSG